MSVCYVWVCLVCVAYLLTFQRTECLLNHTRQTYWILCCYVDETICRINITYIYISEYYYRTDLQGLICAVKCWFCVKKFVWKLKKLKARTKKKVKLRARHSMEPSRHALEYTAHFSMVNIWIYIFCTFYIDICCSACLQIECPITLRCATVAILIFRSMALPDTV